MAEALPKFKSANSKNLVSKDIDNQHHLKLETEGEQEEWRTEQTREEEMKQTAMEEEWRLVESVKQLQMEQVVDQADSTLQDGSPVLVYSSDCETQRPSVSSSSLSTLKMEPAVMQVQDSSQMIGSTLDEPTDEDDHTIVLSGLNPKTTDECISYYFQNKLRSGGGSVDRVDRLEVTSALVHFTDPQDVRSVMSRAQHKLDDCILHVSILDHRHGQLCIKNESNTVSPDCADILSEEESTYLSDTDSDKTTEPVKDSAGLRPDVQLSTEYCVTERTIPNLKHCQLKILGSPRVLNKLYEEYPSVEIFVNTNTQTAFVKASKDIIEQAFTHVQSFINTMNEVKLPLSPALVKMHENEDNMEWIQKTVIDQHQFGVGCHWELCDHCMIVCAHNSEVWLLEQVLRSVFIEIRVHLEQWEVDLVTSPAWTLFVEMLNSNRGDGPTPVFLFDSDSVTIADTPADISLTQMAVRRFLDEHRNQVTFSTGDDGGSCLTKHLSPSPIVEDVITNLKAGQMKVLSCATSLEKLYSKYPGLQVHVDKVHKTAIVTAPQHIMKKALSDVLYSVTFIREVKLPLSPALIHMFEKEDSRRWVQSILQDKKEDMCHWEVCDQHIVISDHSSHLMRLQYTFESMFTEVTVHLEEWELHVLTPHVWKLFVDRYEDREGCPVPILLLESGCVVFVDTPVNVNSIQLALRQFLDEHKATVICSPTVDTHSCLHIQTPQPSLVHILEDSILDLTTAQLNILSIPKALDQFHKQYPGLVVCVVKERRMAVVKAPENIMKKAFSDVLCFVTEIEEARLALSPALSEMFDKVDSRQWIQQTLIDKYDLLCHWELSEQHVVISAHNTKLPRVEQMFKCVFKEVRLCLKEWEMVTVTPSVMSLFVERLQEDRQGIPTTVLLVDSGVNTNTAIIVDVASKVNSTQQALKQFLNEQIFSVGAPPSDITGACSQSSVSGVQEDTIPMLTPAQVKVLSCPAAVTKLYRQHVGLQVSVDRDRMTAVVRAPENIMQKAFAAVLSFVSDVRELKVPLSPALVLMYGKADSKQWIQNTLMDKYELACHWEVRDGCLIISAHSDCLFRLERLFKAVFKETKVCLQQWEAGLLTDSLWSVYVREQQKDRGGFPTPILLLDRDSVTIADVPAKLSKTQLALRDLLDNLGS